MCQSKINVGDFRGASVNLKFAATFAMLTWGHGTIRFVTTDDQIRRAEYRAIYGDPALSDRYGYRAVPSVHIIVKNGHVSLEGVVANQFDKNLINVKANGVPNVFSVENNLVVENEGK